VGDAYRLVGDDAFQAAFGGHLRLRGDCRRRHEESTRQRGQAQQHPRTPIVKTTSQHGHTVRLFYGNDKSADLKLGRGTRKGHPTFDLSGRVVRRMSPHLSNFTRLGPPAGGRNACEARAGISKATMRDADPPVPTSTARVFRCGLMDSGGEKQRPEFVLIQHSVDLPQNKERRQRDGSIMTIGHPQRGLRITYRLTTMLSKSPNVCASQQ
jgi:hypothetical protein